MKKIGMSFVAVLAIVCFGANTSAQETDMIHVASGAPARSRKG